MAPGFELSLTGTAVFDYALYRKPFEGKNTAMIKQEEMR